jgi:hypothetical protein
VSDSQFLHLPASSLPPVCFRDPVVLTLPSSMPTPPPQLHVPSSPLSCISFFALFPTPPRWDCRSAGSFPSHAPRWGCRSADPFHHSILGCPPFTTKKDSTPLGMPVRRFFSLPRPPIGVAGLPVLFTIQFLSVQNVSPRELLRVAPLAWLNPFASLSFSLSLSPSFPLFDSSRRCHYARPLPPTPPGGRIMTSYLMSGSHRLLSGGSHRQLTPGDRRWGFFLLGSAAQFPPPRKNPSAPVPRRSRHSHLLATRFYDNT